MISDLIRLHINDRIFVLISTFVAYFCMSLNLRAVTKYLSNENNARYMGLVRYSGCAMIVSMPLIGIFDNENHKIPHYFLAFTFFTSMCVFSTTLARVVIEKINVILYYDIVLVITTSSNFMCLCYVVFAASWVLGSNLAILEWIIAFLSSGYIITLSILNPYYVEICGSADNTKIPAGTLFAATVVPLLSLVYNAFA